MSIPCKRLKLDPYLTHYKKTNSKWTKSELNYKILRIKYKLSSPSISNSFLYITPKAQNKKHKLNFITFFKIFYAKHTIKKNEKTIHRTGEIFANLISDKGLINIGAMNTYTNFFL